MHDAFTTRSSSCTFLPLFRDAAHDESKHLMSTKCTLNVTQGTVTVSTFVNRHNTFTTGPPGSLAGLSGVAVDDVHMTSTFHEVHTSSVFPKGTGTDAAVH